MPGLDSELARTVYTGGIQVSYLLTLAIGVLTIGSEYRHKTITGTFLATPKRAKVMLAKVIALLGIG
jgi:ABC-2 type transport system permease protein